MWNGCILKNSTCIIALKEATSFMSFQHFLAILCHFLPYFKTRPFIPLFHNDERKEHEEIKTMAVVYYLVWKCALELNFFPYYFHSSESVVKPFYNAISALYNYLWKNVHLKNKIKYELFYRVPNCHHLASAFGYLPHHIACLPLLITQWKGKWACHIAAHTCSFLVI